LTSANLDDVEGSYEFAGLAEIEADWPARQRNARQALQRLGRSIVDLRPQRRLLDFGAAWGFFLGVAKEQGWEAFGLEPLPATAIYARARFGVHITTDTLHADTFPAEFFDVITAFQVFEHLPNPDRDIRHLSQMLRPDGLLLIEVPNFDTWTVQLLRGRHRHFVQDHINFFSSKTLTRLCAEAGLQVVDCYHPVRQMTFQHLVRAWGPRFLPPGVIDYLQRSLKARRVWTTIIGLSLGDIVTVIARKPAGNGPGGPDADHA
jgi:2-polyprenyl-3-methyl-5-hydroxy-6-metoxy-1,4-benzoquinol methylase